MTTEVLVKNLATNEHAVSVGLVNIPHGDVDDPVVEPAIILQPGERCTMMVHEYTELSVAEYSPQIDAEVPSADEGTNGPGPEESGNDAD
jgi:hypothetical protein